MARNRLTPDDIDNTIVSADYYRFPKTNHTVCCLTLNNGFTLIGQSACVDPANFDAGIANQLAFEDARQKVWELEGYLLKQRMFERKETK